MTNMNDPREATIVINGITLSTLNTDKPWVNGWPARVELMLVS